MIHFPMAAYRHSKTEIFDLFTQNAWPFFKTGDWDALMNDETMMRSSFC